MTQRKLHNEYHHVVSSIPILEFPSVLDKKNEYFRKIKRNLSFEGRTDFTGEVSDSSAGDVSHLK